MPLAPVDQANTHLYYEDTGVPSQSSPTYTTLVLVHGAGFQGAVFQHLCAHAAEHNMRLVTVNMRDYHGSTPYSSDELADLSSTDVDRQEKAVRARGLELLAFLLWFIRKENIPQLSPSTPTGAAVGGGISLLGWSWGNQITLSSVAHARELPQKDIETLARYMGTLIIYDPSPRAFGAPSSRLEESYNPLNDPTLSPEEKTRVFPGWCSGYFSHSAAMLDAFPCISRHELVAGFARQPMSDPPAHQRASLFRMSDEESARVVNPGVVERSHMFYELVDSKVYIDNARGALRESTVWPGLRVVLAWCDMSPADTILPTWALLKQVREDWPANGRRIHATRLRGANHFPHWDRPQRTMQLLAELIRSEQIPAIADIGVTKDA